MEQHVVPDDSADPALEPLRIAQGLDAAAELREHDPHTCPCNDDGFGIGPCIDCRRVFEQRRRAKAAPVQRFDVVSVRRTLAAAFHPSQLSTPANGRIRSREEDH